MINSIAILTLAIGQFDCPPVYISPPACTPIYVAPADYIYYNLDGMVERTRQYETLEYGERNPILRTVPVINGFVPSVSKRRLESGGWRIVYDYSDRIPLSECLDYSREAPRRSGRTSMPLAPETKQKAVSPLDERKFNSDLKKPSEVIDQ